MELHSLLSEKREAIAKEWFNLIIQEYPPDTAKFLKNQTNRFANPIGHVISEAMEAVLGHLVEDRDLADVYRGLDGLVRVRAVQDFTASQSIRFIFSLKGVIRKQAQGHSLSGELLELETRIDELALGCFDIYMSCREKIYDLKATELRGMHYRLLQKANLVSEVEVEDPGSDPVGGNGS